MFDSWKRTAENVGAELDAIFGGLIDNILGRFSGLKNDLLNAVADIKYGLIEAFQQTKDWIERVWNGIVDVIKCIS